MQRRIYATVRDLHLYLGLFFSPFVIAFSLSVFFLVHAWLPRTTGAERPPRTVHTASVPANLADLSGRARIEALRNLLDEIGVRGEVGFIVHRPMERRWVIPVMIPGQETTVELEQDSGTATIRVRESGIWDALVTLHKAPGPHLADIRMNWWAMRAWWWLADGTAYLMLFIAASGVYLWLFLRGERRAGYALIGAGLVTFAGMVYGLIR